jgi:hypothetical protein
MQFWIRVLHTTAGAVEDAKQHLTQLAAEEDRLSKAKTLEELHFQRGKVEGIRAVLFLLSSDVRKK